MSKPKIHPDAVAVVTESSPTHFKVEAISDLEQKLAAMVDERLASLARRVDLLYRYTVGDRTGWRYPAPFLGHVRDSEFFPAPDYDAPGGPRRPPEPEP